MNAKEKAAMDAGVQFGMNMLKLVPSDDKLAQEAHITGVLVAAFAGLFTPGKFHGWGWLMGFLLVYYALFLPKSTVVIVDKLGSQPPVAVGNVPIGVAFFGHATSKVGDVMTRFFETAFQVIPATNAQLPSELAYQKNGVMFGNRLIQASRAANVSDPPLRTDLIAFVHNCTVYDLQDGTIDPAAFARSTDIWSLMGTPNPARFTTYGNPVQVDTCPNAYTYLAARLPAEVAHARSILAFQLNPTLEPAAALTAIDAQIEQAYYKTKIATAAPISAVAAAIAVRQADRPERLRREPTVRKLLRKTRSNCSTRSVRERQNANPMRRSERNAKPRTKSESLFNSQPDRMRETCRSHQTVSMSSFL